MDTVVLTTVILAFAPVRAEFARVQLTKVEFLHAGDAVGRAGVFNTVTTKIWGALQERL